jgi:hypothetical protein
MGELAAPDVNGGPMLWALLKLVLLTLLRCRLLLTNRGSSASRVATRLQRLFFRGPHLRGAQHRNVGRQGLA